MLIAAALTNFMAVLSCEGSGISEHESAYITTSLRNAATSASNGEYKVMDSETIAEVIGPERQKCFMGKCTFAIAKELQAQYGVSCSINKVGNDILTSIEVYSSRGDYIVGYQPKAKDVVNIAKDISDNFTSIIYSKLVEYNKPKFKHPEYTNEEIEKAARWLDTQKAAVEADIERADIEKASNDRTAKWAEYDKAVAKRIAAENDFKKANAERIAAEKALKNWINAEKAAAKNVDTGAESEKLAKLAASEADAKWAAAKRMAAEKAAAKWAAAEKAAAEKAGIRPAAEPVHIEKIAGKDSIDERAAVAQHALDTQRETAEHLALMNRLHHPVLLDARDERTPAEKMAREDADKIYWGWCGNSIESFIKSWGQRPNYVGVGSSFYQYDGSDYNVELNMDLRGNISGIYLRSKPNNKVFNVKACSYS